MTASIAISNNGKYDGKEVVQLYIRDLVGTNTRPLKELKGFQKIELKAGETKTVSFSITPNDLKYYYQTNTGNNNLLYDWEAGDFEIMIGGNSRDVKKRKSKLDKINNEVYTNYMWGSTHNYSEGTITV